ncbi:hypothetical protein Mapa_002705 [Marchantia paleacea]|nr:hypothetical protein Mapa_002705 [Marchantia paleacea]
MSRLSQYPVVTLFSMYVLLRSVKKLNLSDVYFCLRWSPIITIHAISHVTQI